MTAAAPLPPAGLCAACRHADVVASPRSTFLRCRRADADPRYPKYPSLPVRACAGYEGGEAGGGEGGAPRARRLAR